MDKDLLRLVIILVGVLVMIGMLIWHFFRAWTRRLDDLTGDEEDGPSDAAEPPGFSDFYSDSAAEDDLAYPEPEIAAPVSPAHAEPAQASPPPPSVAAQAPAAHDELPRLLKFTLTPRGQRAYFNGAELFEALERANLSYGNVRVFERLDKNRMVHFAVGALTADGVFPESGLEEFYCPGLAFYLTPRELEQPLAVFDDFIDTIDALATELDGEVWDNQHQPLTAEAIADIRRLFL